MGNQTESVFRKTLPVTLPSFVNKCGEVGLRFLPMLLVAESFSPETSSWVMTAVKTSTFISIYFGGVFADRKGLKPPIQWSFALTIVGMLTLFFAKGFWGILLGGVLAGIGNGLFFSPARVLIAKLAVGPNRQEGLAWFRTMNNGAMMIASFVANIISTLGIKALFMFDAVTALIAAVIGKTLIPNLSSDFSKDEALAEPLNDRKTDKVSPLEWFVFAGSAVASAVFSGVAEFFFVATAAQAKISFGDEGIKIFSWAFALNTGLCMIFAVHASRLIKNIPVAMVIGLVIQTAAVQIFLSQVNTTSEWVYYVSVLLQTIGEIVFTSVSLAALMNAMPAVKKGGRMYSIGLLVQGSGKIFGGGTAIIGLGNAVLSSTLIWIVTISGVLLFLTSYRASQRI